MNLEHILKLWAHLLCFFFILTLTKSEDTALVTTIYGPVFGSVETSKNGRPFNSFRGIPYASPPIGDLRFRVSKNK